MEIDPKDIKASCYVLFYVPWCGHCKNFLPIYDKIAANNKSKLFYKVNMDLHSPPLWLSGGERVTTVPKLALYDSKIKMSKIFSGPMTESAILSFKLK